MTTQPIPDTPHPAKFSDDILSAIQMYLGPAKTVLDPFAGTGRIHELRAYGRITIGVEIEPEWASMNPNTIHGNALELPFGDGEFDAIATSPCFGNRMADTYDGRDGSKRNTYRIALGRPVDPVSSASMQWGPDYREFHEAAWVEAIRVLMYTGRFVLNIKDHVRDGQRQRVSDWHVKILKRLGLTLGDRLRIHSPGLRFGENHEARIPYEEVIVLWKV